LIFFDPLGLVADGDQEKFDRLRGVEIATRRTSCSPLLDTLSKKLGIRLPGANTDYSGKTVSIPNGFAAPS
jgi:hypothetical protein